MGWFGFGGSRRRDDRDDVHHNDDDDMAFQAVRIDRRGPQSRLPDPRPRRRDYDDRPYRRR